MAEMPANANVVPFPERHDEFETPPPPNAVARFTAWLLPGAGIPGHAFTPAEVTDLLDAVYARGDRIMERVLYVHAAIALALAFFYGTWLVTVACTLAAVGMFQVSRALAPRSFLTRCVSGVALQTFVALHIYQLHGLAEMHFFFFTAFTVMIVYQDWVSMWPGALLIISQHILFAMMNNAGTNLYFFEDRFISFTKLFFHFGIAIVHVALCGYWAYLNREHTLSSAWQRRGLERQRQRIAAALDRSQRSEQAERSMSHLLGTLVEHVPGGILVEDEERRLRHVNRGFCEIAGIDGRLEALRDSDCGELAEKLCERASEGDAVRDAMRDAMRSGTPSGGEELALADGRTLEWDHVPLRLDGVQRGHLWHFRDISARKRAESERERLEGDLRQSQKMQAIGTLAGGVAHDFNNILGAIMGYTELARVNSAEGSPQRAHLDEVMLASRRAADLVRQILAFSRRQDLPRTPNELSVVISDAVRLLRASLPPNLEMVVTSPDGELWVRSDASQLNQVVINLGANAAHAQSEGGKIEIELTRTELDAAAASRREGLKPGAYACLSVRDHGVGMDEATMQRMFEPFFTTKPPGQGTGLGLAVVHGIVQSHGGTIAVESAPGLGTRLTILLPLVDAPSVPAESPSGVRNGGDLELGRGEKIMLVDDEFGIANTRSILLKRLGYEVVVFVDPHAALEDFRRHPQAYDLVLTDHMMPGLDGLRLADAMLEARPGQAILLTSGNALAFSPDDVEGHHLRGLLPKPSTLPEMARAVRRAIEVPGA